jgi:5'-methylthioadenosine phosphorylase
MSATTVGIIGGTGLYGLDGLEKIDTLSIETPYGKPSSDIVRARVGDIEVLFLARHGSNHTLLPSEINYRANVFALKEMGAQWCVSVSAVGSLREEYRPGDIVIPSQYIDRTRHRDDTFFGNGLVAHVAFADPVCPVLCDALQEVCAPIVADNSSNLHRGGTYVCMEGPTFSTRAESHLYRSWDASIIGMTALPEAKLAREAEIAYATMAMVTDYDCWRSSSSDIDVAEIMATMAKNVTMAKSCLSALLPTLSTLEPSRMASEALAQALIIRPESIPKETKQALAPLIGKYIKA